MNITFKMEYNSQVVLRMAKLSTIKNSVGFFFIRRTDKKGLQEKSRKTSTRQKEWEVLIRPKSRSPRPIAQRVESYTKHW